MSNGVKGPTTTHTLVPIQHGDGTKSTLPVEISQPQVGGGFNASSGFQTTGVDGTHNISTTGKPPVSTGSTQEEDGNFGQQRSQLAHAFNTLRKSLRFMNHKGNPNAKQASETEMREALATIAKEMGIKLDTSKGTPADLLTQLASKLGISTGTPSGNTGIVPKPVTDTTVPPNGNTGIVPPSTGTSASPTTSVPATTTPSNTSTVDPMQLFQQMVQKVLGDLH